MSLTGEIRKANDQARTLAAIVGMNAAFGAAIGAGALLRDRHRGRNIGCAVAFDLSLALAGVRVSATGVEHLDAIRPAIFAFNHQSNLDPLVAAKLVRHDFTSTGKAEVRKDPSSMLAAFALDAVLIDRKDPEKARTQMAEAARRVEGGDSIMIAPEGTRSLGPEPGRFRTGVVHMAIATGAPVVPIVLRNTGELMPKMTISAGTVDVCVLAPVDTSGWTTDGARGHAEDLRERMAATIRDWPAA